MRRRRGSAASDEIEFGSDSFLDVIANIVGILVILIVVVGLRVKSLPEPAGGAASAESVALESAKSDRAREIALREAENRAAQAANERSVQARQTEIAARSRARRTEDQHRAVQAAAVAKRQNEIERQTKRQAEVDQVAAELRTAIAGAQTTVAELHSSLKVAATQRSESETVARIDKQRANETDERAEAVAREIALDEDRARRIEEEIAGMLQQAAKAREQMSPTKTLTHYSAPLSRAVERSELHFRCKAGRVARVPLEELFDAAKHQSAKDVAREWTISGTSGPIGGFRLRYLFAKTETALSELVASAGGQRMHLENFEVFAESDKLGESQPDAMAVDSKLAQSLEGKRPAETAVTVWVYPDSFTIAAAVKARLHEQGYWVALRPLPDGTRIAGSPWGSKSRVQ